MKHEILKRIIADQHEIIKAVNIIPREYLFESSANYVLTGLRRAGKSTILYDICRKYAASGVDWNRIIYINFEDERLAEFSTGDFNDIVSVQAELSKEKGIFFFDEIQIIPGWEKFVRRLADAKEHVYVTGSNAKMLSREISSTLGGRFLTKYITPFCFSEYLSALDIAPNKNGMISTRGDARIRAAFDDYYTFGGLPETLNYMQKKEYVSSVYQKVLLGDIITRNNIRNENAVKILIKKIAESVCNEISYSKLHGILKSIGVSVSKDSVIDYVNHAIDAYLIYNIHNYFSHFSDRESNPKYYFTDNGLLNLFLMDKNTALLENVVASHLIRKYPDNLFYMKSSQTGIDVDFYIPSIGTAIQVAYTTEGVAAEREYGNLIKLAKNFPTAVRFLIITKEEEKSVILDGVHIDVVPAYRFLLD